ncbi:Uncharacterised protein [Staphylococcus aureus]|nr:Uncharacterised protein [Staphylococcus aureus]
MTIKTIATTINVIVLSSGFTVNTLPNKISVKSMDDCALVISNTPSAKNEENTIPIEESLLILLF